MADSSPCSRADNRTRWRTLLARYEQSALSQREFCLEHGVALSSFVRWRRVFANESTATGRSLREPAAAGGFVAVRVQPPVSSSPNPSPSVTLPGGVRIENIDLASVALVAALVAAL